MSDPKVRECSYVKVDHDFEYRTNDGRQVVIRKDEKLCLIQKTNNDWWKVIRNHEQRSFYVPVTYVSELRRAILPEENLGSKQDDEQISDEGMKDQSARRRQVEKWLSNTMGISQAAEGGPENLEKHNRLENIEEAEGKKISSRVEQEKRNPEIAEKNDFPGRGKSEKMSSERFRSVVRKLSSGKYTPDFVTSDGLQTVMENANVKSKLASNCYVYSPKKDNEPGQSSFEYQTPSQHQISHSISQNPKPAMKHDNSMDSTGSSNDPRSPNCDSTFMKYDPVSAFNEELNLSVQKNSAIKRYSNSSNDRRLVKPNIEKRPNSPNLTGKKTLTTSVSPSPQSPGMFDYSDNAMKILNDRRKSWAVEELMTELTQIRKERVDDNTSNFVLRSVAIKDRFDPLEKLTQELHDLHSTQTENFVTSRLVLNNEDDIGRRRESGEVSSSKIEEAAEVSSKSMKNLQQTQQQQAVPGAESTFNKSKSPKTRTSSTNKETCSIPANVNTPKSPKRQDEFAEANILNDESRMRLDARDEGSDRKASLSADKERYLSAYQEHSQLLKSDSENCENFEKPSYSNISVKVDNEVKIRPELKLKIKSVDTKIKLTPSLEKLASEIQFLPASRTLVVDNDKKQPLLNKNQSVQNAKQDEQNSPTSKESSFDDSDLINVSQDREMWKNFKSKLNYKSSFKSKQEEKTQVVTKDVSFEEDRLQDVARPTISKLKKSATFNCVAMPEYYKHFQRHYDSRGASARTAKRRSRSLEDIRLLVNMELRATLAATRRSQAVRKFSGNLKSELSIGKSAVKPIPAPRTIELVRDTQGKTSDGLSGSYKGVKPYLQFLPPSISKSYENLSQDFTNLKVDTNKSTAVSFKNLLCTSDSGSDEYLHYKAFPKSSVSTNEHSAFSLDSKINDKAIVSSESLPLIDRSISDEQILSSNISSEALFSQSESEAYALSELSNNSSPVTINRERDNFVNLPPGWTQEYDAQSKQICFINVRGEKWFSSNDAEGKIYFFEENSNESSWLLPSVSIVEPILRNMQENHQDVELRSSGGSEKFRISKARSLVVGNQRTSKKELAARRSGSVTHDWPQLFDGNMCILKEGTLQRAKITENGKRLRKHWNSSYVVLSELFLLFFKDAKSFSAMKSGQSAAAKPDISVDLNGATVQPDEKASSRKNVYVIGTILGLQVLIQSDNTIVASEWYQEIQDVINTLPSSIETQTTLPSPGSERSRDVKSKTFLSVSIPEESKVPSKIGRSRSIKLKKFEGSTEDLSASSAERQTKIKAKLKRFFQRRPTMDSLVKDGIYKDEPAFGSYLKDVCPRQPPMVPQFVKDCIKILERNPENMKADGLYRASGNLSQIQKIRLQVDQNNLDILEQEEDVHVLTGSLKLFFRELKEPLIPYEFFEKALKGSMAKKRSDRIQVFREIVRGLTQAHYDTLQFLLQHLLRVTMYQKFNRMHIPNLAIVFGPTLMWPAVESANMALDLMQQNLVIECLLSEYDKIFK